MVSYTNQDKNGGIEVDYQFAFEELKETLIKKLNFLEELYEEAFIASEKKRLFWKIQGLKLAIEDIYRLEKDYNFK